jgi:hypothetical protein
MTTVRKLKLAAGAGNPDDVLALRVVKAAVAYVETIEMDEHPDSWGARPDRRL